MTRHLAIFSGETAELILAGKKTVDIRISTKKIIPFGHVALGDEVLIKKAGGKIIGKFMVDKVIFYDHPNRQDISDVKSKLKNKIQINDKFWNKEKINYLTVIFIGQVQRFLISPEIEKRDLRGWITL